MRISKIMILNDLISSRNMMPPEIKISIKKEDLWNDFNAMFRKMYKKGFTQNDQTLANLKTLFYYFLRDDKFFVQENIHANLSVPSFDKGLLIVGSYGVGKTAYLKVFEKIFYSNPHLRFRGFNTKSIVSDYELCNTPLDKKLLKNKMMRKLLFIDDLNAERVANNYGKVELMEEILSERYANNLKTIVTCNYTNKNRSVEETLSDFSKRYGGRLHDRIFEMFNIIEFKGKSMRR